MAQKVLVEMLDDIDGSPATQTVPFGLDGVTYEIDLSEGNATALREELARYVAASRRTGGRKIRVATGQSTTTGTADRERSRTIRAWATENGYQISERGRISADVVTAYEQAQLQAAEPATQTRKRSPRKKVAAAKK